MWSISHCGKIIFDAALGDELGESRWVKKARFRTSHLISDKGGGCRIVAEGPQGTCDRWSAKNGLSIGPSKKYVYPESDECGLMRKKISRDPAKLRILI